MIYISRDTLSIIECDQNIISFEALAKIIILKPSNMIYCESNKILCGIISMGDIARARENGVEYVSVNRNFMHVYVNENMKARTVFSEKKNINALPVVNKYNVLLGAYTRWDIIGLKASLQRETMLSQRSCQHYDCVFLIRPCKIFEEKQKVFEDFENYLRSQDIKVNCIGHDEIADFLKKGNRLLFVDEDEMRAVYTLCACIWNIDLENVSFLTYESFLEECSYGTEDILRNIIKKGVSVFNLVWESNANNSKYIQEMDKEVYKKYANIGEPVSGKLHVSMHHDFFDNLYSKEYANSITNIRYQIETKSACGKLKDYNSEVYNVVNGERYTYGQPIEYDKTIYFVGACYMYGHYTEDKNTIESFLQERINKAGYKIKVVNCGSPAYSDSGDFDLSLARILTLSLCKGDIVICGNRKLRSIDKINLMDACYEHGVHSGWLVEHPRHCNHRINSIYADAIYDTLEPIFQDKTKESDEEYSDESCDFIKTIYMNRYFKNFNFTKCNKIGSIVMNCNPFTYGHRYLIERSLQQVDFLIIFVVEEERSFFSFDERFVMVCEGIADLNNVKVVPSGSFILSQTTFPEYFIKITDQALVENVENDITFFAEKIAPCLHIRYRFVGEEPEDVVTNEYNEAMRRILPEKGIEFVEIPRKKCNGQYISASMVRKCLENDDLEKLTDLLPDSTRNILALASDRNFHTS